MQATADVRCYYCGHVSGQMVGNRDHPEQQRFRPREGFTVAPGERVRCERCKGPVYLEEILPTEIPFSYTSPRARRAAASHKLVGAA